MFVLTSKSAYTTFTEEFTEELPVCFTPNIPAPVLKPIEVYGAELSA